MIYEIIDTGEEEGTGRLCLLVHFWERSSDRGNRPPVIVEDFYLAHIQDIEYVPYVRPSGWYELLDGTPVHPLEEVDGQWVPRGRNGIKLVPSPASLVNQVHSFLDGWTQEARANPEEYYNTRVDSARRTRRQGKGNRPELRALIGKVRVAPLQRRSSQ